MGRFLVGLFCPFVVLVLFVLGVWVGDALELINLNDKVLQVVSFLPGLEGLQEKYEIGQERSEILQKRESQLKSWEKELQAEAAKLAEEKDLLEIIRSTLERREGKRTPAVTAKSNTTPIKNETEQQRYVELIGGMKSSNAAAVIEALPYDTAWSILQKLPSAKAQKIMDDISTEYLVQLTKIKTSSMIN